MKSLLTDYLPESPLAFRAEAVADALLIHITRISVLSKLIKDPERFRASNEQFMRSLE